MAHNLASWTLASSLVALGMGWKQAVLTIALANVIALVPMLLTGHAGTRYRVRPQCSSLTGVKRTIPRSGAGKADSPSRRTGVSAGPDPSSPETALPGSRTR
jgi:hypothetical protein